MATTQLRAFGAATGGRYGSFAGKGSTSHPVDVITQARGYAAFTGARYGSFQRGSTHPVDKLTQLRAFGAHSGKRYGSFERGEEPTPVRPGIVIVPDRMVSAKRRKLLQRDEVLLMIAAAIATGMVH